MKENYYFYSVKWVHDNFHECEKVKMFGSSYDAANMAKSEIYDFCFEGKANFQRIFDFELSVKMFAWAIYENTDDKIPCAKSENWEE